MSNKTNGVGLKAWAAKAWNYAWRRGFWRRLAFILLAFVVLWTGAMYGVAQWYIHKHKNQPLVLGASFVSDYASSFGLDPKQTLNAMLGDLKLKQVRLVSYWEDIEPSAGKYDFSGLDWQFAMANKYHAKVSLSIGLRQPRWPECHSPSWALIDPKNEGNWRPQLNKFIEAVVMHYKNNPALQDYELENEYFLKVFGECSDFSRARLIDEYNLVKDMDPSHKLIVSRSDNWVGIPIGQPRPDEFAISVYKRVWDATFTHRYFEYPLPAWFYAMLAGSEELLSGKDMIIHELQAEPWTPNGLYITQTSVKEQFKSMDAKRMKHRIEYGEATGMRTIDLWGAEWWYWLKVKQGDPSVWNVVKDAVAKADAQNQKLTAN
ncbi:beta-galactosidase [Candidatus Saccharibacteria bacterium]|nr:beta-galactosidase [Candidatus Saccharibacteria bacterium]